jgi:2,5-diketo-D-gluconate reductase A
MSTIEENPTVTIADRVLMPLLGLGTWGGSGDEAYRAVSQALQIGYRHVDTATAYGNEDAVGRAVRDSDLPRDEIFVTTKMPPGDADRARRTLDASLAAMGLDHVDLWLVHWPPAGRARPDTWEQFIAARDAGLTRAIGVSNYSPAQIDELISATGIAPAVNQIKWAPPLYDAELVRAHRDRGVTLEGWSPFKATNLDDPVLKDIAARHRVTTPQVILRWHLDHEIVVIPKSTNPERIAANFDVFEFTLDEDELDRIDDLGRRTHRNE